MLISLVIIGIIAAITIPIIHANYTEREKAARIKKTVSILSNAMTMGKIYGGNYDFTVVNASNQNMKDWYNSYLAPYLITSKVCYNTAGCWNKGHTYQLNGQIATSSRSGIGVGDNIITVVLNDGVLLNINVSPYSIMKSYFGIETESDGLNIMFDINGDKKPNTVGKDIFAVVFTEDGMVLPFKDSTQSQINSACSKTGRGYSCIYKYLRK